MAPLSETQHDLFADVTVNPSSPCLSLLVCSGEIRSEALERFIHQLYERAEACGGHNHHTECDPAGYAVTNYRHGKTPHHIRGETHSIMTRLYLIRSPFFLQYPISPIVKYL